MISQNIFKTLFVLAAGAAMITACDSEYNDIGADIIEGDIHHNNMELFDGSVVAYDRATGPVQTNNLPFNSLGIYDNPAFGKTTSHFVTQLELAFENPKFKEAEIDSVYLYVPYYSSLTGTDGSTGTSTYTLNGGYTYPVTPTNQTMTLRVFENKFFLRNTDPSTPVATTQKYYSDEYAAINSSAGVMLGENTAFKISADEVQRKVTLNNGTQKIADRFAPGIFMPLDAAYFQTKILAQTPDGNLVNNNVFKDFMRGIFFQVTDNGSPAGMIMPRFSEGRIVIVFRDRPTDVNGEFLTSDKVKKTVTLNLKGNTINFFQNVEKPEYQSAISTSSEALGDDRIYVKGGQGAMTLLHILKDEDIAALRAQRVLINEANLIFYVDHTAMGTAPNPLRVYLYDLKAKRPIVDYYADATVNNQNQKYDKYVFGGLGAARASEPNQLLYKIRLTSHINNIINKDSIPHPLGLVVTENINLVSNGTLRNPIPAVGDDVSLFPVTSVVSPLGTIFYGNNIPTTDPNYNKRLRLEIFYTKPN